MSISFSTIVQRARPKPQHAAQKVLRDALNLLPGTTVSSLGNGMKVASETNKTTDFVTFSLNANAGSAYETEHYNGTAKVLENINFHGTENQNKAALSKAVEEIGGHLYVETGRERTQYMVKVHKSQLNKAVGLVSDIALNGAITDETVDGAKKAAERYRMDMEEDPDRLVWDGLHQAAFDSTDYGPGLVDRGTRVGLLNVDAATVKKYRESTFTAPRLALCASGNVTHEELEKLATQYFSNISTAKGAPQQPCRYVGGDYRLYNQRMGTTHIAFGFETPGAKSGDNVVLGLTAAMFNKWHRAQNDLATHNMYRIFKVFSSQEFSSGYAVTHFPEKAVETIQPYHFSYNDVGVMGMYMVLRHAKQMSSSDNVQSTLQMVMHEWARVAQKVIHPQELEQAKAYMKAQQLFQIDGATNSVDDMGRQVLQYGRRVAVAEMYDRIDDITATNMQETLQHYYYARRPVFSMYGSLELIPNYDWISNWTWKFGY